MKKIILAALGIFILATVTKAQNPTKEFEMQSILVDACNASSVEPNNEMLVFKVGPNPINIANLTISGQNGVGTFTASTWPTPGVSWNGLIQNAATATVTAALQATISNGCGKLIEPPGGIIPKYASVLMVTSSTPSTTDNSFASLTDSLYIIYHNASYTVTTGHFKNSPCIGSALSATPCTFTAAVNRGFILKDNSTGVSDTITYDITKLINTVPGTPYGGSNNQNDGATVEFAWPGYPTDTYVNNGCKAPFIPLSSSAAPTNTTICNNGSVALSGTAGGTYTSTVWSGGTGTFGNANSLNTIYTPGVGESGTVVLTLSVNGKCAGAVATSTVAVNINAAPLPTISSSVGSTLCNGASTTLSVTSTGTLSTTYSWSPGGLTTNTISVGPSPGANIYTVVATNSCGTNNGTFTVTVNPLPTISATSASVCPGFTATITASGASTYTWSTGTVATSISAAPANTTNYTVTATDLNNCVNVSTATITVFNSPTVAVNSPAICIGGTVTLNAGGASTYTWSTTQTGNSISDNPTINASYTVVGTDVNGCTNFAVSSVTVNALPNITVNSSTICPGNSATLTASGASTYTWNTTSNNASITVTPVSNSSYTVVATDNNGCVNSATASVTIVNSLTVSAVPTNTVICKGSSTTITGNGASTYTWSPALTLSSSTGTSVTASPTLATTYTVIGSSGSCADTATVSVNVNNLPSVSGAATQSVVCSGTSIVLTGSGAQTYTWSGGVSNGISFTPASSQTYTVTGTDVNGCTNSSTVAITVNTLAVSVATSNAAVCLGLSATLTAGGATNYTWTPSSSLSSSNGTSVTASPTTPVTYTVVGSTGNCVASNTVLVNVNSLPIVTVTSVSVCLGSGATLSATGASTYTWSNGQSGQQINVPGSSSSFTVTGIDGNGCSGIAVGSVIAMPLPIAAFTPDIYGGQAPATIVFSNTSTGTTLSNYWNFANGDTSNQTNPSETYPTSGTYGVILTVTDSYGCSDTASATIIVTDVPTVLVIPNVFSPNGDNINEVFTISGTGISTFNCKIYDRWGVFMYEWNDIKGGWDGKNESNGKNVTDGTYYYILNYSDSKSKPFNKQGYLQLVR